MEFCSLDCSRQASLFHVGRFKTELSRPTGKVGEHFSSLLHFWRIFSDYAFFIFPKNKCPVSPGLANSHLHSPGEGACTLMLLVPPVYKIGFQNNILGYSTPRTLHPPLLPRLVTSPFPHVKGSSYLGGWGGGKAGC